MDTMEEFSALVEWLQTFNLQSETSTPSDLSAGAALSEALVTIEPSFFTPSWFAGILHSEKCAKQNLNSVLNLMLHYYRQNLPEVTASGSLEIPDLSGEVGQEALARLLKLMLGIAVTCANRQTFIAKIQSLDAETQHSLTQSAASFIIVKDWGGGAEGGCTSPGPEAEGRVSAQSLTSETAKPATPPGDEVWAQKCHELDFQVALLKEERSNLMVENEELYGKVREAQTLSRKDSVKAKQLETEVDHLKDEFDRLRALYVNTRDHVDNMEKRIRPEERDTVEILKLKGETAAMKAELAALKASNSRRPSEKAGLYEECEVVARLQDQQQYIQDLRSMLEYQVSVQTGLTRELDCLKDQLDVMREAWHNLSDVSVSSGRYEDLDPGLGRDPRPGARGKLPSLRSEACLVTRVASHSQSNLLMEHSYTVSHHNLLAKSTFDIRRHEESKLCPVVKVVKKKLSREPGASAGPSVAAGVTMTGESEGTVYPASDPSEGPVYPASDPSDHPDHDHIYVNNYDYADFATPAAVTAAAATAAKERKLQCHAHVYSGSGESDSGLDVTPEGTPYTSRPESELLLDPAAGSEGGAAEEADVEASPRQLELMMEQSRGRDVEELIRVISDSNIAISVDEIEALVGAGTCDEDYSQMVEDFPEDKFQMESFSKRPCLPIPLDPAEIQLFDPNDPKVKDLEEWNCSVHDKSLYEEHFQNTPKRRLKRLFSIRRKNRPEEMKVLTRINSVMKKKSGTTSSHSVSEYSDKYRDENITLECFKSWLLSIFVKIFD